MAYRRTGEDASTVEFWLETIDLEGLEFVHGRRMKEQQHKHAVIDQAIEIYQEKQRNSAGDRREKREEQTLKAAREANRIARQTKRELRVTWLVGALVAIALALWGKFG